MGFWSWGEERGLPLPGKSSNSPLDIDSWIKSSTSRSMPDLREGDDIG